MSRHKPVLRAIKLLSLIERHPSGLRVTDMAEQLDAPPRNVTSGCFRETEDKYVVITACISHLGHQTVLEG